MSQEDSLAERRQRLLLNLEMISIINDHLASLEYKPNGQRLDLEQIHGSITLEFVKGRLHRIIPAPSYLIEQKQTSKKTA